MKCPYSPFPVLFQEPAENALALSVGHKHSAHGTRDLILGWLVSRGNTSGITAKFFYVILSSLNQIFPSQLEAEDWWYPLSVKLGRTDRPASGHRSLQSCLSRTLPVLCCILEKPKHSRTPAGPLACADTAGGPGRALLLCKVPPDQLQQGTMRAEDLRAGCVWLGNPAPLGSCSGDLSAWIQKMGEMHNILGYSGPLLRGTLGQTLGRFYYFLTEEGAVSSALSFSAGRGAHLGAG